MKTKKTAAGQVATKAKRTSAGPDKKAGLKRGAEKPRPDSPQEGEPSPAPLPPAAAKLRAAVADLTTVIDRWRKNADGPEEIECFDLLSHLVRAAKFKEFAGVVAGAGKHTIAETLDAGRYWGDAVQKEPWWSPGAKLEVLVFLGPKGKVLGHQLLCKNEGREAATHVLPSRLEVCQAVIRAGVRQCLLLCQRAPLGAGVRSTSFSHDESDHFEKLTAACATVGVDLADFILFPPIGELTSAASWRHLRGVPSSQTREARPEYLNSPLRQSALLLNHVAGYQADGLPFALAVTLAGYGELCAAQLPELLRDYGRWMPGELQAALTRRYNSGNL